MTPEKQLMKITSAPPLIAESEQFLIKFAENQYEVELAQRLRYEVFNLEQGKGLDSALENELDQDEYDDYCLHLVVIEKKTGKIVGTYRVHLGSVAKDGLGFYSSREYRIDGLETIADNTIEMGRSCVSPDYRNGAVVALLWGGIAEIRKRSGLDYLLGCVSLETTDSLIGWGLYEYFKEKRIFSDILKATPRDEFVLPKPDGREIAELLQNSRGSLLRHIPPLFKGYLRLGVGICGAPALDREFGTIDFLILLDCRKLPEKYVRHFF